MGGISIVNAVDSKIDKLLVSPQKFCEIQHSMIEELSNTGYPFARLSFDSVDFAQDTLRISARLDSGPLLRLHSIVFKGSVRCDSLFWYAWTGLKPGSVFNGQLIEDVCQRIEETGFARCVADPELSFVSDSLLDVSIMLQKNPSGQFDGLLGYYIS